MVPLESAVTVFDQLVDGLRIRCLSFSGNASEQSWPTGKPQSFAPCLLFSFFSFFPPSSLPFSSSVALKHARNGHAQRDTKPNTALAQQSLSKTSPPTSPTILPGALTAQSRPVLREATAFRFRDTPQRPIHKKDMT